MRARVRGRREQSKLPQAGVGECAEGNVAESALALPAILSTAVHSEARSNSTWQAPSFLVGWLPSRCRQATNRGPGSAIGQVLVHSPLWKTPGPIKGPTRATLVPRYLTSTLLVGPAAFSTSPLHGPALLHLHSRRLLVEVWSLLFNTLDVDISLGLVQIRPCGADHSKPRRQPSRHASNR